MTARSRKGATLQIFLSTLETTEWSEDPRFRAALARDLGARARARGRKFYEVFGNDGASLLVGESS